MEKETDINKLIKKVSTFIESFNIDDIFNLSEEKWQKIREEKIPYATFSLRENRSQTKKNRIFIYGNDWFKIDDYKNEIYNLVNSKKHRIDEGKWITG